MSTFFIPAGIARCNLSAAVGVSEAGLAHRIKQTDELLTQMTVLGLRQHFGDERRDG
jgi:hypothetical protein